MTLTVNEIFLMQPPPPPLHLEPGIWWEIFHHP